MAWSSLRGVSQPFNRDCKSTHGAIFTLRPHLPVLAFALFTGGVTLVPATPETRFTSPSNSLSENNEGIVSLAWQAVEEESGLQFELQQSADPGFASGSEKIRYHGPDTASVLTGFAEGTYHFRIRAITESQPPGAWSEPVAVTISYMARNQVILLLGVGVTVFIATLAALLSGHFRKQPAD